MPEKRTELTQTVDAAVCRQAKTLVRSARFAALGTLEADGVPAVSRVSLATAMNGDPVFLISRLSGHFTNLERDGRCSVLVGEPGKGDPLAHPRMTVIGRAEILAVGEALASIKARYLARHPKAQLYADFSDFAFWRFSPQRASLNGGFGKAYVLAPADLACSEAAIRGLADLEQGAVAHMNEDHATAVDRYASLAGGEGRGWRLACLDPEGLDLSRGDHMARLWFDAPLTSADGLRPALAALAKSA